MTTACILLIDDEVPFVETMTKRLSKRDLLIRTAHSGEEALTRLHQNPDIEVAILDVQMPGMDGIQTLKRIKADFPLVEVIMLTAHATVQTGVEGMKRGAFDYLTKPCDIDELMEKVTAAADRKRQHEEKIVEARMREISSRKA